MTTTKLVGRYGKASTGEEGASINGDGLTPLTAGFYYATSILSSGSGLPAGLAVNRIFKADATITPETGETVVPMTFTDSCDLTSISLSTTLEEIDLTSLCDTEKEYGTGFADLSGSLEGITTIGVSEQYINKAFDLIVQSADLATVTITERNEDTIYLRAELSKENSDGRPEFFFVAPVKVTSFDNGVQIADKQTFSSNFRIATDGNIKPAMYKLLTA